MNKLVYVANIRLPTEKAHGVQIVKMCEAFANQGLAVELIISSRKTQIKENPFDYYGVKHNFKLTRLWCLDTVKFGWLGFWIESTSFSLSVIRYSLFKKGIFYTRDEFTCFWLSVIGKKPIWEVHMGQQNLLVQFLVRFKTPLVAISNGLKDLYLKLGVSAGGIIVAPDGVDLNQFDLKLSKHEAKDRLGLDKNLKFVVYTGSKTSWKGVDILMKAKELLPQNIEVLVISDRPHLEIPLYLKAADILVLPNSSKEEISKTYTSPMKLFEYMASNTPIVASNLPSIKEIIDESTAYFFEADSPIDLARAIFEVIQNTEEANKKAEKSKETVKNFTWDNRAKKILSFIK